MGRNKWWIRYAALELLGIATLFLAGAAILSEPFSSGTIAHDSSFGQNAPSDRFQVVHIGGRDVRAIIADTPALREKGLSGRSGLAPDEGMLFVFPADRKYGFWMKDMRFPIDILWLSSAGAILDMRTNVSPDGYLAVFEPRAPARFVLELPAGFADAYTVRVGDTVRF